MESLLLHCRTFGRDPHGLVVYEDNKTTETASERKERALDGDPGVNKELENRAVASSQTVEKAELMTEISLRDKLETTWNQLPEAKKNELQPYLDEIDWALHALDVFKGDETLAKDKDEIFKAVRRYEIAAAAFNYGAKTTVFPERLGDPIFKRPKDLKKEERRDEAFTNAEIILQQLQGVNYTPNPKLHPAKALRTSEKIEVTELGYKEVEDLAKGPVAQVRQVLKEIATNPPRKSFKLSLAERTRLTSETLAPKKNTARESVGEKNDHAIAVLKNFLIQDTWDTHVAKLTSGKFNLEPAPLYGRVITNKLENRIDAPIFQFTPRLGQVPTPEELTEAEATRIFLDANWKDIVSTYKDRPGVNLMQRNPDVIRNNLEQDRILKDIRNVPEFEALKKQPFSRTILSSPAGILLAILGYFFLDKKDKELLTKTLIGTFVVEKAGGLPGLQALYNQAGDQVPWAKKLIDDLRSGVVNEKSKEYSRSAFENWTGLGGIQKETKDWMLRESDGLSEAKKMGIYVILNDQPVAKVRAMLNKTPPNSPDSIGDYIEQWKVQGRGNWWANSTGNSWNKVKELGKKLGTEGANKAGAGERYVEQFLFGGIMGITPQDVDTFFKAKIEDKQGNPTKSNPMRETVEDTAYDTEQFENALRKKFPETGGSRGPTSTVSTPPPSPAGSLTTPPPSPTGSPTASPIAPSAALTSPSTAPQSATFFAPALSGRAALSYDDSDLPADYFNAEFEHGGTKYHAMRKRSEAGEGFWVEALKADGTSDSATYSLFFPDLATFSQFDRTVEIMARPNGKASLSKLLNDGVGKLPPGSWKILKLETFPTDGDIDSSTGYFSAEITTTAPTPHDKLKLYIPAGGTTFKVGDATGIDIENPSKSTSAAKSYEFDNGYELDSLLKLAASTAPAPDPDAPVDGDPKDPAHAKIRETTTLIENGNIDNPDKTAIQIVSTKPMLAKGEYFSLIKIANRPFNISIAEGKRSPISVFVPMQEGKNARSGAGLEVSFPDFNSLKQALLKNVTNQERLEKAQTVRDAWLRISNGIPGWIYLSPSSDDGVLYAKRESGGDQLVARKINGYWQWSDLDPKQKQELDKYPSTIYVVK